MRCFHYLLRRIGVPCILAFVALLLAGTGVLRSDPSAHERATAQESSAPPQSPPLQSRGPQSEDAQYDKAIFLKPLAPDQLGFLNNYAARPSDEILKDKQFQKLFKTALPECFFHYGHDQPLLGALENVLATSPLPVQIRDSRYVMVSSAGDRGAGRGFVWIDMQDGIALGGFFFRPSNGEPTPTLTIFSNQLKEKSLEMGDLPPAFPEDLNKWMVAARIPPVEPRYFITGDGEKIVLEHDENYCFPAGGAAPPPEAACEQMNSDAADADNDAAYYATQTSHKPNATARMIYDADQVAWIGIRDNTCKVGPDRLNCHIRITRERTRVLIGHRHR
jgi:uncharacterized protein YecT (DUF1311 family)